MQFAFSSMAQPYMLPQVSLQQWQEQHQTEARQCDAAAALRQHCADLEERCQWQEQQQGGVAQRVHQLEAEQSAAQAREQEQQTVIVGLQEQVGLMHSPNLAPVCLLSVRLLARPRPLFCQGKKAAMLSCTGHCASRHVTGDSSR